MSKTVIDLTKQHSNTHLTVSFSGVTRMVGQVRSEKTKGFCAKCRSIKGSLEASSPRDFKILESLRVVLRLLLGHYRLFYTPNDIMVLNCTATVHTN